MGIRESKTWNDFDKDMANSTSESRTAAEIFHATNDKNNAVRQAAAAQSDKSGAPDPKERTAEIMKTMQEVKRDSKKAENEEYIAKVEAVLTALLEDKNGVQTVSGSARLSDTMAVTFNISGARLRDLVVRCTEITTKLYVFATLPIATPEIPANGDHAVFTVDPEVTYYSQFTIGNIKPTLKIVGVYSEGVYMPSVLGSFKDFPAFKSLLTTKQ